MISGGRFMSPDPSATPATNVDYETHPHRSEAMIKVAMVDLMSRRLTRESTHNWRDD
jgi:hypothetical protein